MKIYIRKTYVILYTLALTFLGDILILKLLPRIISFVSSKVGYVLSSENLATVYMIGIVVRIIGIIACIFVMKNSNILKHFQWNFNIKYLILSWMFFVYIIVNIEFVAIPKSQIGTVLLMAISCLLIGLYEEFLFRGLILSTLLKKWGNNRKNIYIAVVLSSVFFGLFHLGNLFTNVNPVAVLTQVIYTSFIGVFFSAILLRTKNNIYWCVLLHTLYDLASGFGDFSTTHDMAPKTGNHLSLLINLAIFIPILVYGLFLLRKVKCISPNGVVELQ